MQFWIVNICLAFLICVLFAGIIIPQILLIAYRKKLFDEPDERKIHRAAVPRLGGFAFKPVICLAIALLLGVNLVLGNTEVLEYLDKDGSALAFLFCAMMMLYLVGMSDDLIGVRYRAKFVVQILCGCCLIAGGIWIDDFHGLFGIYALSPWVGYPLTVLVVVFVINAINLIDGVDGLASGLCCCALAVYGAVFFIIEQYIFSMLAFATLGVLVPFFYYNVFGDPNERTKIFMGDTGSLTIGMMLCALSLKLVVCADERIMGPNTMAVAFAPLLIPCLDVVRVYLHRVRNGNNPFLPDKNHIHHKLLALGLNHRLVMIFIVSVSIVTVVVNFLLSEIMDITLLFILDLIVWTLANIWLSKRIGKIGK